MNLNVELNDATFRLAIEGFNVDYAEARKIVEKNAAEMVADLIEKTFRRCVCGKVFSPNKDNQRYCCEQCASRERIKRWRQKK